MTSHKFWEFLTPSPSTLFPSCLCHKNPSLCDVIYEYFPQLTAKIVPASQWSGPYIVTDVNLSTSSVVFKEELNLILKVLRLLVKVQWVELKDTDSLPQILSLTSFMDWERHKLLNDLSSGSVLPKKKQEEFRINENIVKVALKVHDIWL